MSAAVVTILSLLGLGGIVFGIDAWIRRREQLAAASVRDEYERRVRDLEAERETRRTEIRAEQSVAEQAERERASKARAEPDIAKAESDLVTRTGEKW